ncbi:MAG: ion transporter [Armatimonadetes bacterium]|nr:ion transporter [Armatimonadota bacterium]
MIRFDGRRGPGEIFPDWLEALLLALIGANVLVAIVETEPSLSAGAERFVRGFDDISMLVFTIEYGARFWFSPRLLTLGDGWRARWRYLRTPMAIIDLLAVAPFYLPLLLPGDLRILRLARLVRLFRLLKLTRYLRSVTILRDVLLAKREELLVALGLGLTLLLITATLVFNVEHDAQPDKFPSIISAMWWAVATLTTVGYGDVFPITPAGKMLASVVAILGIGLFALPAGILAAGFTEHMAKPAGQPAVCPHCGHEL